MPFFFERGSSVALPIGNPPTRGTVATGHQPRPLGAVKLSLDDLPTALRALNCLTRLRHPPPTLTRNRACGVQPR